MAYPSSVLIMLGLIAGHAMSSPVAMPADTTNDVASATVYLPGTVIPLPAELANVPLNDMRAARAKPAAPPGRVTDQDAYLPAIHFASAAYREPSKVTTWTCDIDCGSTSVTPNFRSITVGGGGLLFGGDRYFVGYNPGPQNVTLAGVNGGSGTVVVSFQGTDLNLGNIIANGFSTLSDPDDIHFPGARATGARIHSGYSQNWLSNADGITALVQKKLDDFGAKAVLVTGHSQGAADALYQAVALRAKLRNKPLISVIGLAMPRTGNLAWADYVDAQNLTVLRHIGNGRDPIPVSPPMSMPGGIKYSQVSGEIHIDADSTANVHRDWYSCPGRDNADPKCSVGVVKDTTALAALTDRNNFPFHNGPYNGVCMGQACGARN